MNAMADHPRVLVVEDEAAILDGLDSLFSSAGFETTLAADGARALEHLRDGGFDLVILDLMLPPRGRARGLGLTPQERR